MKTTIQGNASLNIYKEYVWYSPKINKIITAPKEAVFKDDESEFQLYYIRELNNIVAFDFIGEL